MAKAGRWPAVSGVGGGRRTAGGRLRPLWAHAYLRIRIRHLSLAACRLVPPWV